MKIEVTRVTVSKKKTVWVQAMVVSTHPEDEVKELKAGDVFDLAFDPEATCAAANEKKKEKGQ